MVESIWGFLLQTMSVSIVAALLLVIKAIFLDKLSPRWQYGVWGLLALRILMPASLSRGLLSLPSLWLETAKAMIERGLDSAYSSVYVPISVKWPVPWLGVPPQSITDWMLIFYGAGALIFLLWYLISYGRLRLALGRGTPVTQEVRRRVDDVCRQYGLGGCRMIAISGLSSPFVCGILRPVLAVPEDKSLDDKVILHELLHLKNKDALQSVLWCVLRALHWCNPFLHYVFSRIGNDMEAYCDQRVLERLEGEARRDYGGILLDMANERYPRMPGTSSLSNGGKNIARRIGAIAHFKRYPRGMALVSVCIVCVLAVPAVVGYSGAYDMDAYQPVEVEKWEQAMALSRMRRCTTVAGALDTYAKGLMLENGIYIATASSLEKQAVLAESMRAFAENDGRYGYYLDGGEALDHVDRSAGYEVLNLKQVSDDRYEASLLFSVYGLSGSDNGAGQLWNGGVSYDTGCVLVPVTICREDAWVVEEIGERRILPGGSTASVLSAGDDAPALAKYQAAGDWGTVYLWLRTTMVVENAVEGDGVSLLGVSAFFDDTIQPDASFCGFTVFNEALYVCEGGPDRRMPQDSVEIVIVVQPEGEEGAVFPDNSGGSGGNIIWTSSDNSFGHTCSVDEDWDGTLGYGGGAGYYGGTAISLETYHAALPTGNAVQILWDGMPMEYLVLEEVEQ